MSDLSIGDRVNRSDKDGNTLMEGSVTEVYPSSSDCAGHSHTLYSVVWDHGATESGYLRIGLTKLTKEVASM